MAIDVTGVAGAAQTDERATGADLRCVVAFSALVNNPTYREAAAYGIFYFLGRLEGRDPTPDLAKNLREVRGAMQLNAIEGEARRCGAELKVKNEALKAMTTGAEARPSRGVGSR